MNYIKRYDQFFDEMLQSPVSDETAAKAREAGIEVCGEPWPDLPIRSRMRSERELPQDQWTL